MGQYTDYVIPSNLSPEERTKTIIEKLTLHQVKANKPCVIVLTGKSGEGKSWTALRIAQGITEAQGENFANYVEDCVVFSPLEYPKKIEAILHDPRLKKLNVIILDEAREIVKAANWYSAINQMVADVNATARGVKPIITIVVTQSIRDIDPATRRTVRYFGRCYRPIGKQTRLSLSTTYERDWDLENPTIRSRKIRGYIQLPSGKRRTHIPGAIKIRRIPEEIAKKYEERSKEVKSQLIRFKLNQLLQEINKEYGDRFAKVDAAVKYYADDPESYDKLFVVKRGKTILRKEFAGMLNFEKEEVAEFEKKLSIELKKRGAMNALEQSADV